MGRGERLGRRMIALWWRDSGMALDGIHLDRAVGFYMRIGLCLNLPCCFCYSAV